MKKSEIVKAVKEVLQEMSMTGGGASFTPGSGEQYATPFAFSKKGQGKNAATKQGEKLGLKVVKRPKHPSHTKMFDFLDEMHYGTPHAFVPEVQMEDSDAVKHTEEMGYTKVKASKKSDIK
jgi:hypothetical protein